MDAIPTVRGRPKKNQPTDPKTLKWAVYTRISTDDQEESGDSLEVQADKCRRFMKGRGLPQADGQYIYKDVCSGGKDPTQRDGMIALLRNQTVQGILCACRDRLGRGDLSNMFSLCAQYGTLLKHPGRQLMILHVDTVESGIDPTTSTGYVLLGVMDALAGGEKMIISERCQKSSEARSKLSLAVRQAAYGERHVDIPSLTGGKAQKRVEPHNEQLQVCRFICWLREQQVETSRSANRDAKRKANRELAYEQTSWAQIAHVLDKLQHPPPRGKGEHDKWIPATIRGIHTRMEQAFRENALPPFPTEWIASSGLNFLE
jgi:DNA invertase Pin-like site-specific DNA recombinase